MKDGFTMFFHLFSCFNPFLLSRYTILALLDSPGYNLQVFFFFFCQIYLMDALKSFKILDILIFFSLFWALCSRK